MNIVEQQIASALTHFIAARPYRIACDGGTLEIQIVGGELIAILTGKEYSVEILVQRRL